MLLEEAERRKREGEGEGGTNQNVERPRCLYSTRPACCGTRNEVSNPEQHILAITSVSDVVGLGGGEDEMLQKAVQTGR